jgi:hypothetical protein
MRPEMNIKLKHWYGFQAIFSRKAAWVLGFSFLMLGNSALAEPERAPFGLRVTIGAAIGMGPTQREERWPGQEDTFEFVLADKSPIRITCETSPPKNRLAQLNCVARPAGSDAWRESFSPYVIVGRCADSAIKVPDGRAVSFVICMGLDVREKPRHI